MTRSLALALFSLSVVMLSMIVAVGQEPGPGEEASAPIESAEAIVVSGDNPFAATAVAGGEVYLRRSQWEAQAPDPETVELMERDGELGEQVAALAAQMKSLSDAAERADAEKQLAALVAEQFAVRQSLREQELTQLEAQLARLRELHQQRTAQKDRIIADRVQQLLREAEGLGWGDAGAGSGGGAFHFRTGGSPWRTPLGGRYGLQERRVIMSEDALEAATEAAAAAAAGEAIPADAEE